MRYLFQGSQSAERFELLLSRTGIRSESSILALRKHLVDGLDEQTSMWVDEVRKSNFSRDLAKLNEVAEFVEKVKEIDLYRGKNAKQNA